MNKLAVATAPPARLLLATDFSARSDRALERAAQLAHEWQAEMIALNVLEHIVFPDQVLTWMDGGSDEQALEIATRQMVRDLEGLDVSAKMRITHSGDTAESIRDVAASTDCGLVVTGVARNELFGDLLLGSTVERLARTLPQPLLVVRNRVHEPYRRIVVAIDFSASSRHALLAAVRFFPGRELTLYHASPLAQGGLAREECERFIDEIGLPAGIKLDPVIEEGKLEATLSQYVRRHEVDVVTMGTQGRSGVLGMLLGSSAAKLLDWLPCDALIVRQPQASH